NAPEITIGNVFVSNDDNSDGRLDPGETGDINFTITNSGHADADFAGTLSEASDPNNYLNLGTTTASAVSIAAGANADFTFAGASADAATPLGSPVGLQLDVTAGASNQYSETSNQDLIIGIIPIYPISDGGTLSVCTGTFYDSGLDTADYQNSEDYTMTFMPGAGEDFVVVEFTSFDLESGYDYLHVYDGPDTNSPEIDGSPFTGTTSPGTLTSANGLTFNFTSDGSVTHAGWAADVSCFTPTTPPDCPTNPVPENTAVNVFPVKISWDAPLGASSYDVYFGTDTDPLANSPVTVTTNSYNISPEPNTTYYWTVLPTNSIGTGSGCEIWSFTTGAAQYLMENGATVTTCDGVFYDEGGPDNNYSTSLDQTMTFLPGTSGKMISANFTEFDVELGSTGTHYDYLQVYDGTDANATLIGEFSSDDGAPVPAELQPVTATNPDGALTFVFHSDNTVTKAGWTAEISCVGGSDEVISQNPENITIVPNPGNGLFTVKTNGINNGTLEIYSVSGKLIYKRKINTDAINIDITNNAKGIYFVKISSENKVFNSKLIIK
ncbi:MAG: T9SS type A sorting domain-containing protein, partial [Chlorobi bacterium]|nr:T9SS type A sorting domain-containing protein [Chlorobiota bacterium]